MKKLVFLFCGVESTGKTYSINKVYDYLTKKGYKSRIVSEAGRDVCLSSGGVDEMSLMDYELILHKHQSNLLEAYNSDDQIILLDTDSTYTRYYLEKDIDLYKSNIKQSEYLIDLSENIANSNLDNKRINHVIYLNSNSPFVQDGTRTYEKSRKEDDVTLINLYKKIYNKNCTIDIIDKNEYEDRLIDILQVIDKYLNIN